MGGGGGGDTASTTAQNVTVYTFMFENSSV